MTDRYLVVRSHVGSSTQNMESDYFEDGDTGESDGLCISPPVSATWNRKQLMAC